MCSLLPPPLLLQKNFEFVQISRPTLATPVRANILAMLDRLISLSTENIGQTYLFESIYTETG